MEHLRDLRLLDEHGNPLDVRIESALSSLVPRFRKQFPALRDDQELTEVLEQAGRKIAHRERQVGPIARLHGYAWVTLRNVAASWLRRGPRRLGRNTLACNESEPALAALPAERGTPTQIETAILLRELQTHLSRQERLVLGWKKAGFSSEEIAQFRGTSVGAVDALFSRAKHKIRTLLRVQQYGGNGSDSVAHTDWHLGKQAPRDESTVETRDDEAARATGSLRLRIRR